MVFDPAAAPRDKTSFVAWYDALTEWSEPHDYDDPANAAPCLQAWYRDMIQVFPAMNGPDASDGNIDNPMCAGYTCAKEAIYVDFRWSVAETAYDHVRTLARDHRIGFFDVSDDGSIWFPSPDGSYGAI